jgi:hypothetical protein
MRTFVIYISTSPDSAQQAALGRLEIAHLTLAEVIVEILAKLPPDAAAETVLDIERRTAPRYPLLQKCFVWPHGSPRVEPWRSIVYNISLTGLGVTLPFPASPGNLFQVEPYGLLGARTLEVRVLRVTPVEFLWFCGCELTRSLRAEELQTWIAQSRF